MRRDVIAGISVAALLIPELMGYAGVAGLPPELGLYAAPLALVAYAILGRSTVLVVVASSTAAISASVIAELNDGAGSDAAVSLSASLALFAGIVFVCAGCFGWEWVANFMSTTVITSTVVVGASSLVLLFGLERFVKKLPVALTVVSLGVLYIKLVERGSVRPARLPGSTTTA